MGKGGENNVKKYLEVVGRNRSHQLGFGGTSKFQSGFGYIWKLAFSGNADLYIGWSCRPLGGLCHAHQ